MIKVEQIELRGYVTKGILDDEHDCVNELLDRTGYLCDAISEQADSYIPTYNADVWENASAISEYIEEAISEGIAPTGSADVDLIRIFQSGYYVYYQEQLYNNLEAVVFNYVAEKINSYLESIGNTDDIDIDEVKECIENAVANIDNNDTFDALDDIANEIIEDIKGGEYAVA